MAKELETLISVGGQLDPSLLKVIQAVNKNIDGLEKQVKAANAATKTHGGNIGNVYGKIASGAKVMGSAVQAGFQAAAGAAKIAAVGIGAVGLIAAATTVGAYKLAEKSSALAESQNVVEQTFKSSAKAIKDWTLTTAKSAGISQLNAMMWSGSMGAMLKSSGVTENYANIMSRSLVQLSGDMSSFYNLAAGDAWEKIRAGIAGETEPLKQLGINLSVANLQAFALSQGIKTSYAKTSQAQQTMLRYNYLMKVTADAQGDFGRTLATSFPNQLRVAQMNIETLGNTIGTKFQPAFLGILQAFNKGFDTGNWAEASQGISYGLRYVLKTAASMVPQAIEIASSILPGLITGIVSVMPQFTTALVGGVLSMLSALSAQAPAMIPALLLMARTMLTGLVSAIVTYGPMLAEAGIQLITGFAWMMVQAVPQALPVLTSALTGLISAIVGLLPLVLPMLADAALGLVDAAISVIAQSGPQFLTAALDAAKQLALGLLKAAPKLIPAALSLIQSLVDWLSANHALIIEAGIQAVLQLALGLINALPQLVAMVPQILLTVINTLTANLPLLFSSGAEIIAQLIVALIQCLPTLMAAIPQIVLALAQALFDNIPLLLSFPKQLFDALVPALGAINWGEMGLSMLKAIVNGLASGGNLVVNALNTILVGSINKFLSDNKIPLQIPKIPNIPTIPAYANGIASAPGGLSIVGENGPELLNVPPRSTVYNNTETRQMLGGGGGATIQFFINITGGTGAERESLTQGIRQVMPDLEAALESIGNGQRRVAFG